MVLVTRNSPLIHSNNKCPDQYAHRPVFLESVYEKNQKYLPSFKQFGSVGPDLCPHRLQTKNDRETMPPPHPSPDRNPGIAHEPHRRIKSEGPGPKTIAVFVFNDPPTVKVI